ncbi:MAG TPA: hypothetical protein VLE53_18715 [Gemmatimonadaceae bacterium]|nr:hypothetical protein [Gemmatimonadaceae bacterium]
MTALRSILATVFLAALNAIPSVAPAQERPAAPVDLTGKWLFNVTTDAGSGTPTVTMTQRNDSLAGHYSSQALGEADFTGTVKDGKFRFDVPVSVEGTSFVVTYEGTIESRVALKGTVRLGDLGTGTFTATRQQ